MGDEGCVDEDVRDAGVLDADVRDAVVLDEGIRHKQMGHGINERRVEHVIDEDVQAADV